MAYYSDRGPWDGLLLSRDRLSSLDVFDSPDRREPVGTAHGVGMILEGRGPVVVFRLAVEGVHDHDRWFCRGRRFIPFGETVTDG